LANERIILHSILPQYSLEFYGEIVDDIKNLITSLVRNHGFTDGAKRFSIIKNYTIDLVEGRKPDNPGWISTSRTYSIPSKLGINFIQLIVDYLTCTEEVLLPKYYQCVNTILNIVRMVDGLTSADLTSIEERSLPIEEELLESFETYVSQRLLPHRYSKPEVNLMDVPLKLLKRGPNRKPKVESAIEEAQALLRSNLNKPFARMCNELNLDYLYSYLVALVESIQPNTPSIKNEVLSEQKTKLRVLVPVPDSGFKTRIVAIVDFWTQLIMVPVRNHVQSVIEAEFRKTDFRKDHNLGVTKMVEFQRRCIQSGESDLDVRHLKFYDITSWTDRFHRDLQKITMKHLFSSRLSEAWAQLTVHCPWHFKDQDRIIKYGQGQGMGTNGSFDIATLTDHLFINYLIDEKSTISGRFTRNECYGKVGDDLWIYDPDGLIPEYYEKINLPINFSKSKEFSDKLGSIAEFCSRTFINSVDVSRVSPKIISKSRDFRYIPLLLGLCSSRGIQLSSTSFDYLQNNLKDSDETYLDKLQDWLIGYMALGKYEQSSHFKYLTLEYLEAGNWLTERTKNLLGDQLSLDKLIIAHSIVELVENVEDAKVKVQEIYQTFGEEPNMAILASPGINLFDVRSEDTLRVASMINNGSLFLPRNIAILRKFIVQQQITGELVEISLYGLPKLTDPQAIMDFAKTVKKINLMSNYDNGNISYDLNQVQSTQFKFVKTLRRLNADFSTLSLDHLYQVKLINDMIPFDSLEQEWKEVLPTFDVATTTPVVT
jgi:hypothetical protein